MTAADYFKTGQHRHTISMMWILHLIAGQFQPNFCLFSSLCTVQQEIIWNERKVIVIEQPNGKEKYENVLTFE